MALLAQLLIAGFFAGAHFSALGNRPDPNYQELIAQCRRETTQASVQRVYHDIHEVAATEAICGVRNLKVNKNKIVAFEMPVTIVNP
jgi:hypothetical protein